MSTDLRRICGRRAELLRELADLDVEMAEALIAREASPLPADDVVSLETAAGLLGEPSSTFRRRPEYAKALLSRPGERRLRYSRTKLERIKADRLAANGS